MRHDGKTHRSPWRALLSGVGLVLLGSALVAAVLFLVPERTFDALPPWGRLAVVAAVMWLPALGWIIALLARSRWREAAYTTAGALVVGVLVVAIALVLLMAAVGSALSNYG